MAKALVTVASLIEGFLITGLSGDGQKAFVAYCASEYGALADDAKESFSGLKLTGSGDKAKGKLNRGTIEFKGGHSVALITLSAASVLKDMSDSIKLNVGKVNVSALCETWWNDKQRKALKAAAKAGEVNNAPSFNGVASRNPGEPVDDGTIEVDADEANNVNA